ncbi:MAG: hypothetical protein ACI31B_10155 [Muribaculaceae bacterium]
MAVNTILFPTKFPVTLFCEAVLLNPVIDPKASPLTVTLKAYDPDLVVEAVIVILVIIALSGIELSDNEIVPLNG